MQLNFMTFNLRVHVLEDGDNAWPNRINEVAEAIKQAQADIVCTQEGLPSMLQDLQALLPEYQSIGASRSSGTPDECCARMCTWAKFSSLEGKEWIVYNTHLDHVSEEARQNGIQLILSKMNPSKSLIPSMLTGDFNCEPSSKVIELIHEAGLISAFSFLEEPLSRTYHGFQGGDTGSPIDYIYMSEDARISSSTIDRSLYNGRYPSDHYPITTTVILD
ncbi:endonuclease/exonuclease/phosphatase family protein [Paenibacillus sp. OV219]|uniref:endonuclease/exonuclease/phosphatase family protein n=1 Tax=Paenibacillus sp. OV219 TaxID=1884377 RepID=UPI0008ADD652|nr:endonuclease/exonuclease/phosphatase family protein [Paenibacillus sp. OV219]SEM61188.1 Metal-dependent hydrolase, endonuclease/exonuclease/phosphatase family [Paenibacillus sp. OV219]